MKRTNTKETIIPRAAGNIKESITRKYKSLKRIEGTQRIEEK